MLEVRCLLLFAVADVVCCLLVFFVAGVAVVCSLGSVLAAGWYLVGVCWLLCVVCYLLLVPLCGD